MLLRALGRFGGVPLNEGEIKFLWGNLVGQVILFGKGGGLLRQGIFHCLFENFPITYSILTGGCIRHILTGIAHICITCIFIAEARGTRTRTARFTLQGLPQGKQGRLGGSCLQLLDVHPKWHVHPRGLLFFLFIHLYCIFSLLT